MSWEYDAMMAQIMPSSDVNGLHPGNAAREQAVGQKYL
jgi:hypothetical protein